jgi:hypothetical protein
VKTRKAVVAAGLMAGLATLPLSARADTSAPNLPKGSATASALSLTVSLAPLKAIVDTSGALKWQAVVDALNGLRGTLCPGTKPGDPCQFAALSVPMDLPNSLTLSLAQAKSDATLNAAASDILSGTSASSPVATDWTVLNANISAVEQQLADFITTGTLKLQQGGVTGLTDFLKSPDPGKLQIHAGPLGTAKLNILGTVAAALNQKNSPDRPWDTANAVQVTLDGTAVPAPGNGTYVSVSPFAAYALNAATKAPDSTQGPQVSAANTTVGLSLPALKVSSANTTNLLNLSAMLKSLVDALTKAIADPGHAGNILGSIPGVPAALQGPLSTIGGLVTQAAGTVTGSAPAAASPVDLAALKLWDANLSAALDSLHALINALAGLNLPDVSNLVSSHDSIATSTTKPLAGGGVTSAATAMLGQLSVLPVGDQLSTVINTVIGGLPAIPGITVNALKATTPLLQIEGITSQAKAEVGPGTGKPIGSAGLHKVSVLGQSIDLDGAMPNLNGSPAGPVSAAQPLGMGEEWHHVFDIPTVGAVTLDITRGVPQVVADTPNHREINMAALEVRLINGNVGCSKQATQCHELVPAAGAGAVGPRAATAATPGAPSGIKQLGGDGDVLRLAVADTHALSTLDSSAVTPPGTPPADLVSLPKTGMFGGAAIPVGLVLIGVAISLRVVPGLRTRLRRMR